jgi:AraC-like DNA-binding protein
MIAGANSSWPPDPLAALLEALQLRLRRGRETRLLANRPEPLAVSGTSFVCTLFGGCHIAGPFGSLILSAGELALILDGSPAGLRLESETGEPTTVITGAVQTLGGPLLHALPTAVPICSQPMSLVTELVHQVAAVRADGRPGTATIVDQLLTLAALETLRQKFHDTVPDGPGWLSGLRDAEIGPILSQMLRSPGTPWTVESLATLGPMARSTFARRFRQLVGEAPMDVLTAIRMRFAAQLLRHDGPLKDIARQVGYRSVSAFSVAFRRCHGCTPSEYRTGPATVDTAE